GLPAGPPRRTPGLGRGDVAGLPPVLTVHHTPAQAQRAPQPGAPRRAARAPLSRLAGHTPPASVSAATHVTPALLRVLDRLHDTPALILSSLGETLIQNGMAEALFGASSGHTGPARS